MALYNLSTGFYSCRWQYTELQTAESTEMNWSHKLEWHTIGHTTAQRLVKAVAEFYQGHHPAEFLITHNLGGSFKWKIQKVVGYNVVAWHCNAELVALWLRPMREYHVNLAIERLYSEYRLLVTNAETMQLLYVVDQLDTKNKLWHEILEEVGKHLFSPALVTDMEHDHECIRYIYKGRKLRANQALVLQDYDNDGNQIKHVVKKKPATPDAKQGKSSEKKPISMKKPAASEGKKAMKACSKK